jgi:hypothetical protein
VTRTPSRESRSVSFDATAGALGEYERGTSSMRAPARWASWVGLDLKRVVGAQPVADVDRRQAVGAPQLEAAAQVAERLKRQSAREPRGAASGAAHGEARAAPSAGAAARQVAGAEHESFVALDEDAAHLGELLRRVGEVAVHLSDHA